MTLAHPVSEPYLLPVSPALAAWIAALLVVLVALAYPEHRRRRTETRDAPTVSWAGPLSRLERVTRSIAVSVLLLAMLAGRLGADDELENLAPALVVGALWPLLVLTSVSLGPVWRWIDPWDAVARALARGQDDEPPDHVWPAVLVLLPWVWYLSAYSDPLGPRSVGAALGLYTLFTVAGCLAVGRRRWLASVEPLGIVLSWMALLPRGRLAEWSPPRGAEALLGALAGGVLFGAIRQSELWGGLNTVDRAGLVAALGVAAAAAVGAAVLAWMAAAGARPAVAQAAVPAVAGIIVAVALDRNRLFTSVQLLPGLFGDPFGEGWDLLGRPDEGLDPAPLGTTGLLWAQVAVVAAGHLAGAVVVARQLRRRARLPAVVALAILVAASVIGIASH